jgi:hypothetical protein
MPQFLKQWVNKFRGHSSTTRRPASLRRKRTLLELEPLEERRVPTVTFTPNPQWGPPTATTPANPSVLNSTPIEPIFWGDYWKNDPNGPGEQTDIEYAGQSLFNSGYLNGLQGRYGSDGVAIPRYGPLNVSGSFPNGTFSSDDLYNVVSNNLPSDGFRPLVVLFTPPGVQALDASGNPLQNVGGYHTWAPNLRGGIAAAWISTPGETTLTSWSSPGGGLDLTTSSLSHEAAEAFSDADTSHGTKVNPSAGYIAAFPDDNSSDSHEIGDYEPDGMTYVARVS